MCLLWTPIYFRSRPQLLIDATPDTEVPSQSNEKYYSSADALLTCLCIYPLKKCLISSVLTDWKFANILCKLCENK